MKNKYSTVTVSEALMAEILEALKSINSYGSIEIYVNKNTVTQITVRSIKKTGVANVAQINT